MRHFAVKNLVTVGLVLVAAVAVRLLGRTVLVANQVAFWARMVY